MVDNVSKKTFWVKFYNLVFFAETLSLKKLLQQELLAIIKRSPSFKIKINNWKQFEIYLSEKTILCPLSKSDFKIGYRCAISFYLAKLVDLPPLSIAEQLHLLLTSSQKKSSIISNLDLEVNISNPGYIDFYLGDRSICLWLDYLIFKIANSPIPQLAAFSQKNNSQANQLFPLSLIYQRCNSLLNLGRREGLLEISSDERANNFQRLDWVTNQASDFYCFRYPTKIGIPTIAEKQLSWQILWLIDLLLESEDYFEKNRKLLVKSTCKAWTQFVSECRFCGEIKEQNRDLAKARLSLIALYFWCLENLLVRANCDLDNLI